MTTSAVGRFQAAIFDMDGLLIDSEPLWGIAEREVLGALGLCDFNALFNLTVGCRMDEAVERWYAHSPWTGRSKREVGNEVIRRAEELIYARGEALPGAVELVLELHRAGFKLAVASSSPPALIDTVMAKLELGALIPIRCSAVHEALGKPDPAVYLSAASALGTAPAACIAFEDSVTGLLAATRAGMFTVAVPAAHAFDDPGFRPAQLKIASLAEFSLTAIE